MLGLAGDRREGAIAGRANPQGPWRFESSRGMSQHLSGEPVHRCTANPFDYQGPVARQRLIERRSELENLQRAAPDRVAVRLAAPRRFGKTRDPADDAALAAIDLALAETRDAHQAVWDGIGRVERVVLLAVADGQAPTGTRVAEDHRIARSTLQDALERLLADERHLQRDDEGRPFLVNPLFAEWLRRS
jgi:hypothetical protein